MEFSTYGVTQGVLDRVSKQDIDSMVKDALVKLEKTKGQFEQNENSIFWCRFMTTKSDIILFICFLDPDDHKPVLQLLTWFEAVQTGIAAKLDGVNRDIVTKLGEMGENREVH